MLSFKRDDYKSAGKESPNIPSEARLFRNDGISVARPIDVINASAGHFLRRGIEKSREIVLTKTIRARARNDVLPFLLGELNVHIRLRNLLRRHVLHPKVATIHSRIRNDRFGLF